MTDLAISVLGSQPDPYAAVPTLLLRLRIEAPEAEPVHAMVLKAQIRIEPQRRRYSPEEEARLVELFGEAPRSGARRCARSCGPTSPPRSRSSPATPRSTCRCRAPTTSRSRRPSTCTRSATGRSRSSLLFNGTVFSYRDGGLVVQPVAWNVEAEHRLPVSVWRATMDAFFPNSGWIRLRTRDDRRPHPLQGRPGAHVVGGHLRAPAEGGRRAVTADPFEQAQRVADAVLWEGYVLYPYRASAAKNQVRWQYGVLAPRPYSEADGYERWSMQTECVARVRARGHASTCGSATSRCRRAPWRRRSAAGSSPWPSSRWTASCGRAGTRRSSTSSTSPASTSPGPAVREVPITLAAGREVEALGIGRPGGARALAGRRRRAPRVRALRPARTRSPAAGDGGEPSPTGPRPTCLATRPCGARSSAVHTLLHSDDARFISLLEPPEFARAAVESCTNDGTFPVLIGDPDDPTTVLSSPIILYDHPAVAAESPGDMCDATEIDEILALRILTLTDDEKRLARSTDPRAAAIVDRIEGFSPDVFASLHGEMRAMGGGEPKPRRPAVVGTRRRRRGEPVGGRHPDRGRGRGEGLEVRLRPGARPGAAPTPRTCSSPAWRPPWRACSSTSTASSTSPSRSTTTPAPSSTRRRAASSTSTPTKWSRS